MSEPGFVDLLEHSPRQRVEEAGLRQSLTFAFSSGGTQAELARALAEARPAASLWDGDCFAEDLFLGPLIERCLWRGRGAPRSSASAGVRRYLLRALTSPPRGDNALDVLAFRQAISAELDRDAALGERLQAFVARIEALFELLEAGGVGLRLDPIRRGLDILVSLRATIDAGVPFEACASGLRRIGAWSRAVQAAPGYARVKALLEYDRRSAVVQLNVRLGREGDVRALEVIQIQDNRDNPFHVPWWRRAWGRLGLLLRGVRLRREEVFARLVHDTFDAVMHLLPVLLQLLGDLEFYRLGSSLARFARERGLAVCLPTFGPGARELTELFNPFLLLEEHPPRPCDLTTRGIVVITGPNSGGKTRLLQALGISQVLGQAGLFIPARAARLPWQDGLFASLSLSPEVDQREGRLGTELLRIRRMFEKLEVGSLVLVDELCSGTNPAEAEELFRMVLALLLELSAHAFVTTHFLEFASRLEAAQTLPGLEFLRVGLDTDNRPTYRFEPGVAPSALAQATARRLGVTETELASLVRAARERKRQREHRA
ncbi:MAG: DNA mismatch repair protein [Deltaproteobacteria bacterium]